MYFIICDLILLKLEGEVYMVYEQDIRLIKMTEVLKKQECLSPQFTA